MLFVVVSTKTVLIFNAREMSLMQNIDDAKDR